MEEYTQITLNEWTKWKEDIRQKLKETAENFVYIGYRLKQIRDSGMFNGCEDIFDFAKQEYGLEKSTVSRFIAINEKFSEGGNSLELKNEYAAFGSSKLAEMLTLSDAECQLITEHTTVREIRELKQFGRQQDASCETGETEYTQLQKCIIDYFSDVKRRDDLNEIMRLRLEETQSVKNEELAAYHANPGEYATHKKGMIYLFLYDFDTGVKYKSMMQTEPVSMSWTDFINEIVKIYKQFYSNDWTIWDNFYGIPTYDIQGKNTEETLQNQGKTGSVATAQQKEGNEDLEEQELEENEDMEENSNEEIAGKEDELEDTLDGTIQKDPPEEDRVVDSPIKKLKEDAEELVTTIGDILCNWTGQKIPQEELKKAKRYAERLAAVLEQVLCMDRGEDENIEGQLSLEDIEGAMP